MSDELPVGHVTDNSVRLVREYEIRTMLGQILTIIDSVGLPDRQDKATKDLIKQTVWKSWHGESFWNQPLFSGSAAEQLISEAWDKALQLSTAPIEGSSKKSK